MERVNYLLDTDILIDWLQGKPWARSLILNSDVRVYCSSVSRKELLSKQGLSDSERQRIARLLQLVRVLQVDPVIAAAASELLSQYADSPLRIADALVAATAWTKGMALVTRNRKHYEFIREIRLFDLDST